MEKQNLTEILNNPHFNQFAAILCVTMAPGWRVRHPEVPSVRGTLERLARLNRGMGKGATSIREDFIKEWTALLVQIQEADDKLAYSVEDLKWLIEVLDGDAGMARVTLSMLFATASTRIEWLTLDQVSDITGTPESSLRRHATQGKFVGAHLAGKTWIVPSLSLKAYGYTIPSTMKVEQTEE